MHNTPEVFPQHHGDPEAAARTDARDRAEDERKPLPRTKPISTSRANLIEGMREATRTAYVFHANATDRGERVDPGEAWAWYDTNPDATVIPDEDGTFRMQLNVATHVVLLPAEGYHSWTRPGTPGEQVHTVVNTVGPLTTGRLVRTDDARSMGRLHRISERDHEVVSHYPGTGSGFYSHDPVHFDDMWFEIIARHDTVRVYENAPKMWTVVVGHDMWYTVLDTSGAVVPVTETVAETITETIPDGHDTRAAFLTGYFYALGLWHGAGEGTGLHTEADCADFGRAYAAAHAGLPETEQMPVVTAFANWAANGTIR